MTQESNVVAIVPPGASLDELVEVAIRLFTTQEYGTLADAPPGRANRVLVFGLNQVQVGDLLICVDSFPDEIGPVTEPKPTEEPVYTKGTVKANNLNMRRGPGTNFAILRTIPKGAELIILEELKNAGGSQWYRVDVDGLEGFVYAPLIDKL